MKALRVLVPLVLVFILVIVFLPLAFEKFGQFIPADRGPVAVSGKEVADGTARFVARAMRENGSFVLAYLCPEGVPCTETDADTEPFTGFAIASLAISGDKARADIAMARVLAQCENVPSTCGYNFFAFDLYFQATGDARYKAAMEKAGSAALSSAQKAGKADYERLARTNVPEKLARMHELTKDARYLTALKKIGDGVLAMNIAEAGPEITTTDGYQIHADGPILAGKVLVPAFLATRDQKYKQAIDTYYGSVNIASHAPALLLEAKLWEPLVATAEAFTSLASLDGEAPGADAYLSGAETILQYLIDLQYDSSKRSIHEGNDSFFTRPAVGDNTAFQHKTVNENGRLSYMLATSFADVPFTLNPVAQP